MISRRTAFQTAAGAFLMPAAVQPFDASDLLEEGWDGALAALWAEHRRVASEDATGYDDEAVDRLSDHLRQIEGKLLATPAATLHGLRIKLDYLALHAEALMDDHLDKVVDSLKADLEAFLARTQP